MERSSTDGPGGEVRDPRRLVRDVLLRDGSTLRLQATQPSDFEALKAFYESLEHDSRYFRFHGLGRVDMVARAEADASGVDRLALVGRHDGEVVSVASYNGLREPGVAEVALAVADRFQRRGIGTRMLEQLAAVGAERSIHRFDAEVMSENRPMLAVFANVGFAVRREGSFGDLTVSLDIELTDRAIERIDERDHFAAVASLQSILAPRSVAVVGALAGERSIGRRVLTNLINGDFAGLATPVSPEGGIVCSRPAAHALAELAEPADLVVIAAGGEEMLRIAGEAAAGGSKALLVATTGADGEDRAVPAAAWERLLEIVRDAGMRLVGPNSLGVINTASGVRLNATFSEAPVRAGGLAMCSESGAPGIGMLGHAAVRKLGISSLVAIGDRVDVSTNDLLEYWEQDSRTAVAMLYVETFGNPQHFTRIAKRASRRKPILALKARRRREPAAAEVRSQAAALLGGDAVVDALLHQAGVLRCHSVEELFDTAVFLESQRLPRGRRVAIVSNSSGAATLAADACAARGLDVPALPAGRQNPRVLAVAAGPHEYAAAVSACLSDPRTDALLVSYVALFEDPDVVLAAVSGAAARQQKPVVASIVGSDGTLPESPRTAVPNFLFPESCAAVLARAAERRSWLSRPLGERPRLSGIDAEAATALVAAFLARQPTGGWLALEDAAAMLASHGIPLATSRRCGDIDAAVRAAADLGRPVTLKADTAAPADASEIGAVLTGLAGEGALQSGWRELVHRVDAAGRDWTGAVVQPLPDPGADVLIGAAYDPDLGPVLTVGPGGRHAGNGHAAAYALLPGTDVEADELIDGSDPVAAELDGRGNGMLDRAALRDLILRFARLLRAAPELTEADLNPVRCMRHGCLVLSHRLRVEPRRPVERIKTW